MSVLKNFLLCTDVWSLVSYTRNHFVNSDVNYSYILYANSDGNYNYILVSKDVLQLSGKEVELSCERVTVTVSRGRVISTHGNSTDTSSSRTRIVGG